MAEHCFAVSFVLSIVMQCRYAKYSYAERRYAECRVDFIVLFFRSTDKNVIGAKQYTACSYQGRVLQNSLPPTVH